MPTLIERIKKTTHLFPREKQVMVLLAHEQPLTPDQIIDTMMNDHHNMTFDEVFKTLEGLKRKGLVVLHSFRQCERNFKVDVLLKVSDHWTGRI
jgi:Fe2+ or Zn2+ uptake regulation protein